MTEFCVHFSLCKKMKYLSLIVFSISISHYLLLITPDHYNKVIFNNTSCAKIKIVATLKNLKYVNYAAYLRISNSVDVLTFSNSSSTRCNTGSSNRYSLQFLHCETGSPFRITIVVSLLLKGRLVTMDFILAPQI